MEKILQGTRQFLETVFPQRRELFERLARKQTPQALFITCSDSRIDPNLITQTEPGDLFIMRNIGNIIPPHGSASGGEGAAIEYAIDVLQLRHVIVCGHSHCGAMKALLHSEKARHLPAVRAWFAHAEATQRIAAAKYAHLNGEELERAVIAQNVLVQIENLRTHPCVAAALACGELSLHGWVYSIETGEVLTCDSSWGQLVPLTEQPPAPVPVAD